MSQLTGRHEGPTVVAQDIYEISETPKARLGDSLRIDQRVFHYAQAGAAALVAGKLCESAAFAGSLSVVEMDLVVPTEGAVGTYTVYATANATDAVTANQFAEGYLYVYSGSAAQGVGQTYKIRSHTAAAAGGLITITLYDKLIVLISTSATVGLISNLYKSVLTQATTSVGIPVGVPLLAVTASYYCWLQTWGPCNVLKAGTSARNTQAVVATAAAGAVGIQVAAGSSVILPQVGYSMDTAANTKYGLVFLQLAV